LARSKGRSTPGESAAERFQHGLSLAHEHPLLGPMLARASVIRNPEAPYPREGWANVTREGQIYVHAKRIGEPREWLYVLGHCVLHLGFGHFQQRFQQREWDLACECIVWQFLFTLKLGEPPEFLRRITKAWRPGIAGAEPKKVCSGISATTAFLQIFRLIV
jgi:hypothetical protein